MAAASEQKSLPALPPKRSTAQNTLILTEQRSIPEAILIWFLQVLGAVAAIVFGVFGILSWSDAGIAKRQADLALDQANAANMLALVALCAQGSLGEDTSLSAFCNGVQAAADASIRTLASSLLGPITPTGPTIATASSSSTAASTSSATSSPNPSPSATETPSGDASTGSGSEAGHGGLSFNGKLGLGLGIATAGVIIVITAMTIWTLRHKRRSARLEQREQEE